MLNGLSRRSKLPYKMKNLTWFQGNLKQRPAGNPKALGSVAIATFASIVNLALQVLEVKQLFF